MTNFERDWADTQRSRLQDELREEHRNGNLADADRLRRLLGLVLVESGRMKDEALDAKLQQEWDDYEQELPK